MLVVLFRRAAPPVQTPLAVRPVHTAVRHLLRDPRAHLGPRCPVCDSPTAQHMPAVWRAHPHSARLRAPYVYAAALRHDRACQVPGARRDGERRRAGCSLPTTRRAHPRGGRPLPRTGAARCPSPPRARLQPGRAHGAHSRPRLRAAVRYALCRTRDTVPQSDLPRGRGTNVHGRPLRQQPPGGQSPPSSTTCHLGVDRPRRAAALRDAGAASGSSRPRPAPKKGGHNTIFLCPPFATAGNLTQLHLVQVGSRRSASPSSGKMPHVSSTAQGRQTKNSIVSPFTRELPLSPCISQGGRGIVHLVETLYL